MSLSIFDERLPVVETVQADDTWATDVTNLHTTGNLPERVDAIWVTTDSAAAIIVRLIYGWDGNNIVGSISVPAGAGRAAAAPIQLLTCLPENPHEGLLLLPGAILKLQLETALAAGKTMAFTLIGGQL